VTFEWDPTLFAGSASYYARGRVPYPPALAPTLRDELGLDRSKRLLDIGCGPGSLTLLLAPFVGEAVGIDADGGMIREAQAHAAPNTRFLRMRAEELPGGLGTFDAVTFAQSLHWMDQDLVARLVSQLVAPGGAVASTGASTDAGEGDVPHEEIAALVRSYLGPVRRAGQGLLPQGTAPIDWDAFPRAGFSAPRKVDVPGDREEVRTADDIVAAVFSRSYSAPHLFGDRRDEFERDLRALLTGGPFHERFGDVTVTIWTRQPSA
jgi:SAM-dependent methyltransferase